MSKTPSRPRRGGRFMYQSHPDRDTLFAGNPSNLVTATQNVQPICFDDLLEMHQVVWDLAGFIVEWQPDLIPFFATGGIPYLIPVMHILERMKRHSFIDGQHFHLFPGLTWGGAIGDNDSETYFASTFGSIVRQRLGSASPVRVLVIDTTNSGNAINKAVALARGRSGERGCDRHGGVESHRHSKHKPCRGQTGDDREIARVGGEEGCACPNAIGFSTTPLEDRRFALFSPLVPDEGVPLKRPTGLPGTSQRKTRLS